MRTKILVGWVLIGLSVVATGGSFVAPVAKDLSWLLQVLAPATVGFGVIHSDKLKRLIPNSTKIAVRVPVQTKTEDKDMDTKVENIVAPLNIIRTSISLEEEQRVDLECLNRIAQRCKETPEGMELVRKLHDVFFSIHHGVANEKKS